MQVLQMLINTIDFGMNVASRNAPRFHHQWLPDELRGEGFGLDTLKLLKKKSQNVVLKQPMGSTQSIMVGADGILYGASIRVPWIV